MCTEDKFDRFCKSVTYEFNKAVTEKKIGDAPSLIVICNAGKNVIDITLSNGSVYSDYSLSASEIITSNVPQNKMAEYLFNNILRN